MAGDARVLRLERNLGFAGGCNAGAAATTAPLLFFLNPDAQPAPGCLDALRAAADAHPGWGAWQALVALAGGAEVNTCGGEVHWLGVGWSGGYGEPVAAVTGDREVAFASGAALVVRRGAWDAAGGFDPDYFMYGEDLDLSLRLRLAGWGIGLARAAEVEHDYAFEKGTQKWFLPRAQPLGDRARRLPAAAAGGAAARAAGGGAGVRRRRRARRLAGGEAARAGRRAARAARRCCAGARAVQAAATVSASEFAAALTAGLDNPFLGPAAQIRPLAAAQAAYWRLVRSALP